MSRTVKNAAHDLFAAHGLTTIFGNPGSNELPFLAGLPDGFRYILGLHEGVVASMADGYAQASGRAALVNLHAASGSGNAMGALTNAWYAHTPLVITAGQQVRETVGQEVMLSNVEAVNLPRPLVKWSAEPSSPRDVVRTLAQAIHLAALDPAGPVYVSIPYDDWAQPASAADDAALTRRVSGAAALSTEQVEGLAERCAAAENPVLVLGPDVDSARANDDAVRLAERLAAPVWVAPSASRCPFPTVHPAFRGVLPASVRGIAQLLTGHDLVIVIGAPVFRYHQYEPGDYLPPGASVVHLTCDPGEASRAPFGDAVVAPIGPTVRALADAVTSRTPGRSAEAGAVQPDPLPIRTGAAGAMSPDEVLAVVDELAPADAAYVNETTSTVTVFWERVRMRAPGSYYFPASGGLGFGLAAAVGVQLAVPERRVIAVIGDGSANYGITALWTAAQYRVPVVFIVLNNGGYAALRGFSAKLGTPDVPGLDVPGIDFVALATGYGVRARRTDTVPEFRAAFADALAADTPTLIEVPIETISPFAGESAEQEE